MPSRKLIKMLKGAGSPEKLMKKLGGKAKGGMKF
jgi:hypothetical protein